VRSARVNERGTGQRAVPARMLLALLGTATDGGVQFAADRTQHVSDVAVRTCVPTPIPIHDTIATFRRENLRLGAGEFRAGVWRWRENWAWSAWVWGRGWDQ